MNKAIYTQAKDGRFPNYKSNRSFNAEVFKVHDPPCPGCRKDEMSFFIFENFQGTGQDWIQWKCDCCGFFKNVEIL
ncbi:MAG: hypothetical protein GYA24_06010 [Candidatus Lokiarchaeota archaeon]|nr:hypothetical protein [Candidatus Lokiarchaeota archaeon]